MNPDLLVLEMTMLETNIDEDDTLYEEAGGGIYGVATKLINLLQKLIIKMKAYLKTMKNDFDVLVAKVEQKAETRKIRKMLNEPGGENIVVSFPNVQKAVIIYQKALSNLQKKLKKLIKENFTSYKKKESKNLDYMIDEFEADMNAFEDQIEDALGDTVRKKGKEALQYMEENKRSFETVYRYYFNLMRQYEAFKIEAEKQLQLKDVDYGLTGYDTNGAIAKLISKLSSNVSKISRRLLVKVVYFTV
jgi:hypothetical protein